MLRREKNSDAHGPHRYFGHVAVVSTAQAAAQAIQSAIMTGSLKPGDRLIEQKLASAMGIGQPTLREALKELEFQGFVQKIPKKGTCISNLSAEDYRRITEVRIVLEALAVDRAVRNMTQEAENELAALVKEIGIAAQVFDLAAFHDADVRFHRKIWALADNEYLKKALEGMAFQLFVFSVVGRGPESRNEFLAAAKQHVGIFAGLRSRDPAEARRAFVTSTLEYWNKHYSLGLRVEDIPLTVVSEESPGLRSPIG